jgi:hypothetical protein
VALVIDATPLGANCNSYISLADADTYVTDRVTEATKVTAWDALTDAQKSQLLVRATEILDSIVSWYGDRYSSDQNLKWPRVNVVIDGWYDRYRSTDTTFPPPIGYATVEMALFINEQDGAIKEDNDNALYDEVAVGPLRIDFNNQGTGPAERYFPAIVAVLLKDFGTIDNPDLPNTGRMKIARVSRA